MRLRLTIVALAAGLAAAAPAAPASAAARTARIARTARVAATVVAPAVPHGAGADLPVLLSRAAARRYHRPVVDVHLPRRRGAIHWGTGHLALARLRPGDRLTLRLRGLRVRRADLHNSGAGDSFDVVGRELRRTAATAKATIAAAGPVVAAAQSSPAPAQVRALSRQLETQLTDLDALASDLQTTIAKLARRRPADRRRRAAVATAQRPYADGLAAVRDQARRAAASIRNAIRWIPPGISEGGDQGGESPPPLPVETTSAVSDVTGRLSALLSRLGLPQIV